MSKKLFSIGVRRNVAAAIDLFICILLSVPLFWFFRYVIAYPIDLSLVFNPLNIASILMLIRDCEFKLGGFSYEGMGKRLMGLRVSRTSGNPVRLPDSLIRNAVFGFPLFWMAIVLPLIIAFNSMIDWGGIDRALGAGFIGFILGMISLLIWIVLLVAESMSMNPGANWQRRGDRWAGTKVIIR